MNTTGADPLSRCRALLETVTPLKRDCGRLCGAACCESLPGEKTGMLLFPGEEALCGAAGFSLAKDAEGRTLLFCGGRCDRSARPLACRLFPLLPVLRDGAIRVETDARARAVCPLAAGPLDSYDPRFVAAVREAGEALAADPAQRAFLEALTRQQDEWKRLRARFGGR